MKWKTQAGDVLDTSEMTDTHLANSIRFMERNSQTYHPKYKGLIEERNRRAKGEVFRAELRLILDET